MRDLPWDIWVIFGFGGAIYILLWLIFSKSKDLLMKDPIISKIAWIILSFLLVYIGLDNLEKGGLTIIYKKELDTMVLPLLSIWWILFCIGGYQKFMRPGYPIDKRRLGLQGLIVSNIAVTILVIIIKCT